jgi:hypothetical protein
VGRPKIIFDLLMNFWPLSKLANRLGNQPVVGFLVRPLFNSTENESIILPVHQAVRAEESVVLPPAILEPLIAKSDARVLLHRCICRHAEHCATYPEELGCLFLGEGATRIHPSMGRSVSTEEALAHTRTAMEKGLFPWWCTPPSTPLPWGSPTARCWRSAFAAIVAAPSDTGCGWGRMLSGIRLCVYPG